MRKPLVSIVMTAYNAAQFLPISIGAALLQDYEHYEVIVLDDGSIDESSRIGEAIRDTRLRYVRRERLGRARAVCADGSLGARGVGYRYPRGAQEACAGRKR